MTETAQKSSLQEKMRQLTAGYLRHLKERIERIERCASLLEKDALGIADRAELQIQAHKLSGTGATYGFPAISACGGVLEDWLMEHKDNTPPLLGLTHKALEACRDALRLMPDEEETPAPGSVPPPVAEMPLLLIVDDDEETRNMLAAMFRDDARIITGVNSKEAAALMSMHRPDLVLLDDMMPGGVSGLRMLEDRRTMIEIRDIPVIMVTASKKKQEVMRGLRAGAADYIAKPFDPKDVEERVKSRLKRLNTTILVADDDPSVREMLDHKFHEAGLRAVCVKNERDAWAVLQKQKIALALIDRMMPERDEGMTLLCRMKENPALADIPVIFLTARHYSHQVKEGLAHGVADYIVKPFSPNEVVMRCLRLLKIENKSMPMKSSA